MVLAPDQWDNFIREATIGEDTMDYETQSLVRRYVTNVDSSEGVFCLRDVPEEIVAVLFAMYSRSSKGLRENLADMIRENVHSTEPIPAEAAALSAMRSMVPLDETELDTAKKKASAFHEKWVVGYGHASVAEHAMVHLAVENCSILAAKVLEDARLASYTEKSTRYIKFGSDTIIRKDTARVPSEETSRFEEAQLRGLRNYHNITGKMIQHLKSRYKKPQDKTDKAWETMVNTKAFDLCRGLIPAGCYTSLGITINARELAYSLQKWSRHPLQEIRDLADCIRKEAKIVIPTLLKYSEDDGVRSKAHSNVLSIMKTGPIKSVVPTPRLSATIDCLDYVSDSITNKVTAQKLAEAIILELQQVDLNNALLSYDLCNDIIKAYVKDHTMHSQPGRALEVIHYDFGIVMDFGAWRDLHRHRMLTQSNFPVLGCDLGYYLPEEFKDDRELFDLYTRAMAEASSDWKSLPDEPWRQYVVPLAYHVYWRIHGNLREFFYMAERRSGKECHPAYRYIVQAIARQIMDRVPALKGVWNVDFNEYEFARDVK